MVDPINDPYEMPPFWQNTQHAEHINTSITMTWHANKRWWTMSDRKLILGDLVMYFYYSFVIAFYTPTTGLRISENFKKSSHMGTLLNNIHKDKKIRIDHEQLLAELAKYLREDFYF